MKKYYRHFKGKLYLVLDVTAHHSETGEQYVIYKALYGDCKTYVRPYLMFASGVDHEKYPNIKQKYRFEQVGTAGGGYSFDNINNQIEVCSTEPDSTAKNAPISSNDADNNGELPNSDLLAFLDAETYEEKRQLLIAMRPRITDRLIDDIAVSLDVIVEEGDLEKRFRSLLYCVSKLDEYEVNRLR